MAAEYDSDIVNLARSYVQTLRQAGIRFESAWLFGSFAKQRATPDSDIDIAVVMPEITDKFEQELVLMRYRRQIDLRIEPHILSSRELDTPFSQDIMNSGIRLT